MGTENINDIKDRVAALLRKASDGAATEAEAEAAMRLAQKLMAKYQVTEADLESGDTAFKTHDRAGTLHKKTAKYYLHPVERYCAAIVGRFCGVVPYTTIEDGVLVLRLFGFDSDVELATWMLSAFVQQCEADWLRFKMVDLNTKRLVTIKEARQAFVHGFAEAVNKRLNEWLYRKEPNSPDAGTSDSTALTIKKASMVEAELSARGVSLWRSNHRGAQGNHAAARGAGFMSGSRADTGRGVGASAIMIGR